MTTATSPEYDITLKGKLARRKRLPVTKQGDDTLPILGRLLQYMAGGERRPRFIRGNGNPSGRDCDGDLYPVSSRARASTSSAPTAR